METLRSCASHQVSFVKFQNHSKYKVSIEWIDFRGDHQPYLKDCKPGNEFSVKTYVGHPWVAYETHFRYPMMFSSNRSMVFFPVASKMISGMPTQSLVKILTPLLSLEKLCLQVIHKHLFNDSELNNLNLPRSLQKQLEYLIKQKSELNNLPIKIQAAD